MTPPSRLAALVLALLALVAPTSARGAPPCATGDDHELVETRCDGLDNDCDGLVDVLLPVAANECQPAGPGDSGAACAVGHAACLDGQRACLAPGRAPEVRDGRDNDCNGLTDDVPPAPDTRARALILVPGYVFWDAPLDVDDVASILDQRGIATDRPSGPEDFDAALPTLAQYPLVIVAGYLEEDFLVPFRQAALERYAAQGGVLVIFKPILDAGSSTQELLGTSSITRRFDVDALQFDGDRAWATRAFDSPEELRVPLRNAASGETPIVHVLTPAGPATTSLATAFAGGVATGSVVTRRAVGTGSVYALGHDLHTSLSDRCYVNCFEPAGDLAGLFLREAFREGTRGHLVLKHTVPGVQDSIAILSHDLDALDAQQPGPDWGDPGALQVAEAERQRGARGSFFVTTQTVTTETSVAYYAPETVRALCALGMCPVGAHSVVHGIDFGALPLGTCAEMAADYAPASAPTLCGEVGVSLELLTAAIGTTPIAWRSPYLEVNPLQYDVLAARGVLYDSSYAVGDLKSNLPLSLARTGLNQGIFHHAPLYSMPIALEDGIGGIVDGVSNRQEMSADTAATFATLWTYAMLRNADNDAHTLSLLHPSYGLGQPHDNVRNKVGVIDGYLQACQARDVKTDATAADLADFWRAREETAVDASWSDARGYDGTITTGAHAARGLTLEFGDALASFDCPSCGGVQLAGKRVTLLELAPTTAFAFHASVAAAPAPSVPAAPGRWLAALVVGLALAGARAPRRRAAVVVVASLLAGGAAVAESPYCAKVRERAADDAALLMGPRLIVQALRFPNTGQVEGGTVIGDGFQARAGVVFSATDLYKGLGVLRAGDADCREHEARVQLDAALDEGDADARHAALDAQIAFLDAHAADARAVVARASAQFASHLVTLTELDDVRARAAALDRQLVQARGQSRALDAKRAPGPRAPAAAPAELARRYADAAGELDRAAARTRAGEPWQLEATAGFIPWPRTDWYGLVQLGFNLGGIARGAHASRAAQAHAEEIARAPYEAAARARQAHGVLGAALDQGRHELELLDGRHADLEDERHALEGSEAPNVVHQRETLALEQLSLDAERAYTRAYVAALEGSGR